MCTQTSNINWEPKKIWATYFKKLTNTVTYFFLLRQVEVVGSQKSVVIYKNKNLVKLWDLLTLSEIHTFQEVSHFGSYGDHFAIVSGNREVKANLYKFDLPK